MRLYFSILLFLTAGFFGTLPFAKKNIIRPAVGDLAPEIKLPNKTGDSIALSDLRGKVIFIDFWASWCRTCRVENIPLRNAYNTYKDETFDIGNGFEVYSISLDTDSLIWQKAIKNDQLVWENHVCDFKKWDSPLVSLYNFRYLPHNVLIDRNGIIIAKGLFGEDLANTLREHLAE